MMYEIINQIYTGVEVMFKARICGLIIIGLSGCSTLSMNTTIGYPAMDNYNKDSIETIITDGKTTKSDLNTLFGSPINTSAPKLAYLSICQNDARYCDFSINFGSGYMHSYLKGVEVRFNENNVVISHRYHEIR